MAGMAERRSAAAAMMASRVWTSGASSRASMRRTARCSCHAVSRAAARAAVSGVSGGTLPSASTGWRSARAHWLSRKASSAAPVRCRGAAGKCAALRDRQGMKRMVGAGSALSAMAVAEPVLTHRVLTTFNAESEGITSNDIISRLVEDLNAEQVG